MPRVRHFAGFLMAASGAFGFADQGGAAKAPPPKPAVIRPVVPKNPGGGRAPKGPRLTNPANPASRLYRATPEQRERALEKLPARQQDQIRKHLEWFDGLPKQDQAIVLKRAERYESLSPEARQLFNQQFRALNQLPPDRKQAVAAALRRLQTMTDEQRTAVLASPQFRGRFSPEEQKLIGDLSLVMPPPL